MKSIHFHAKEALNDIATVDLVKFVENITSEARFKEEDIYFVNHNRRDEEDSNMTRVSVDFMGYSNDRKNSITWRWHCYRAKNCCCYHISFERLSE